MLSSTAFRPYTMPEAAVATARCSNLPESVLLDTIGHIGPCEDNVTRAEGTTSVGWRIQVSLEIAEPPILSRFFVHFPDLRSVDSRLSACVTGADAGVLLIRLAFPDPDCKSRMDSDVFIYRVAPGTPSLCLLPSPNPIRLHDDHVAILSCVHDVGDNNSLVVIPGERFDADGQLRYDLQTFSTKTNAWSTRVAAVSPNLKANYNPWFYPTKVFSVEGGLMAWVDLRYGILLCNVLAEEPCMSLIKLDPLMGSNKVNVQLNRDGMLPPLDSIRDVTFTNGCFKFIEMEYPESDDEESDDENPMQFRWRATVLTRTIDSQNWEHYRTVDPAELTPADSCSPLCFPKLWDYKQDKLALNTMIMISTPTLDMFHDDIVYMISKLKADDLAGWVLAINTLSNKVEKAKPFSAGRSFSRTILQCAFSKAAGALCCKSIEESHQQGKY